VGGPNPGVELEGVAAGRSIVVLAVVPPTCHKQRSRAVSGGQSRSLREGPDAGHMPLTWTTGTAQHCMACKVSGFRISSAPPALTTLPPRAVVRAIGELLVVTALKHRTSIDSLRLRWDDGRSAPPSRLLPGLQQCLVPIDRIGHSYDTRNHDSWRMKK
jgi:hypothetical protein